MRLVIPLVLLIVGIAAGGAAGFLLRPPVDENEASDATTKDLPKPQEDESEADADLSYVKINNQFVVPVIEDDRVSALVVLSISLETNAAETSAIYDREPKLRDAFLQVLFDHAYMGGFDGVYTASPAMESLKRALLASARNIAGAHISSVLITDIVRQDV
ncbi:flagellar basal body-associated FliL family protein [Litoreibacter arenae]|uniref:flagellar basal body-associated FliL family protein n=1 Tax=Litoreibacter arenae TaxID=491388 RepID=UPI000593CE11|nr:flagellar basal body-associated FliL family protein [Litoreibacter arenae]